VSSDKRQSELGSVPVKELSEILSFSRADRLPTEAGIGPASLLLTRYKVVSAGSPSKRFTGMVPVTSVFLIEKISRFVRLPRAAGIVPERSLPLKENEVSESRDPSADGMVPVIPSPNTTLSTAPSLHQIPLLESQG